MNKEITIYELLELIKDDKAPKKIVYDNYIWRWTGDDYHTILKTEKEQFLITGMYYTWLSEFLNDKVEIIEEDNKIEKLDIKQEKNCKGNWKWKCNEYNISTPQKILGDKINELIDEINYIRSNK